MKDRRRLKSGRGNRESESSDLGESHEEDFRRSVATRLCFREKRDASAWEIFLSSRSSLAGGEIVTIHLQGRSHLQSLGRSRTFSLWGDQQRLCSSPCRQRRTVTLMEANTGRGWGDVGRYGF
ncbi:hypothetical protein TIFTF001_014737 [Ficus carica]|uniref:Uncharacterized protein n=1 Tax=Ficus carica TaxID=3494 RepID=A0AA88A5X1_FICCA|nr:hypothetical protein TIFTF001_014737 [Ficus carica]